MDRQFYILWGAKENAGIVKMKKIKRLNEKELREIYLEDKKKEYSGNNIVGLVWCFGSVLPLLMLFYFIFIEGNLTGNWLRFCIVLTFGGSFLLLVSSIKMMSSLKKLKKEIEVNR